MSVELLEDEAVLVEADDASEQSAPAPAQPTQPTTAADKAAASKAAAADIRRKVDEAEAATDTPVSGDPKLDALSVRLPHLPSPFDAIYPRTRGGDRWTKIVDDGHCMIAEITPGDGKGNVPVLNRVYINVEGKLQDGTTFLDFPVEELDFTLGQAQVPKGLEMAICQMSAGQHSLIRCYCDYGFSTTRRPPHVPADAMLFMSVRVIRWEKEKNLHEMTLDDKMEFCQRRRAIGKELFQTGKKPRSAIKQYEKACTVLDSINNREVDMKTVEAKNEMLVLFWVNQAQCWNKLSDYSRVVELCNQALKLQPEHVKCLYRRAEARKAREEWDEASRDYQTILDIHAKQSTASSGSPTAETVDELVLLSCRNSLRDMSTKRNSQANAQRKKLDGFMKSATLYDDMPMVSPTAAAAPTAKSPSQSQQPEEDYSWLNKHSQPPPSMWNQITDAATAAVAFVRSWCGQKKKPQTTAEEAKKQE